MFEKIIDYLTNNPWLKITIEAYLIFLVVSLVLYLVLNTKKSFRIFIVTILMTFIAYFCKAIKLDFMFKLFASMAALSIIFNIVILSSDYKSLLNKKELSHSVKETTDKDVVKVLCNAISRLSDDHTGALITFEMHNSILEYCEDFGVTLNSDISEELLLNIFTVGTKLHDGAVVIRGNKIMSAAVYYNVQGSEEDKSVGARHRAAKSISQVTDSYTVVVSEETGRISVAYSGNLHTVSKSRLEDFLLSILGKEGEVKINEESISNSL